MGRTPHSSIALVAYHPCRNFRRKAEEADKQRTIRLWQPGRLFPNEPPFPKEAFRNGDISNAYRVSPTCLGGARLSRAHSFFQVLSACGVDTLFCSLAQLVTLASNDAAHGQTGRVGTRGGDGNLDWRLPNPPNNGSVTHGTPIGRRLWGTEPPFSFQQEFRFMKAGSLTSPRLLSAGRAPGKKSNEEPEHKAADVRPPGHPAETLPARGQAQRAIVELQQKPESKKQNGGQVEKRPEEKRRDDGFDARIRIKPEIRAHYAGNGPARPDGRHLRMQVGKDVQKRGRESAQQIKAHVSQMPESILNVVPKNPQHPHVADQMHPTPVQKHRREQRQHLARQP